MFIGPYIKKSLDFLQKYWLFTKSLDFFIKSDDILQNSGHYTKSVDFIKKSWLFTKSQDFLQKVLSFHKKSWLLKKKSLLFTKSLYFLQKVFTFYKKSGSQLLASQSDGIMPLWNAMRSCYFSKTARLQAHHVQSEN